MNREQLMKIRSAAAILGFLLMLGTAACKSVPGSAASNDQAAAQGSGNPSSSAADAGIKTEPTPPTAKGEPRTIRDFFMALPGKYFVLEGCERDKDPDCRKAKLDYLKTFTEVEDAANGYLKGGCDGAQSCLEMTIFKRPDGTYLVAVATEAEMITEQYFLDVKAGQWSDVAAQVIPQYSKRNIYELPRQGTTVKVFAKKVTEKGSDYEIAEKGARLYDLIWKDGKFSIKK